MIFLLVITKILILYTILSHADDPELYRYKVEQIRDNDVSDLELSLRFMEEKSEHQNGTKKLVVSTVGTSREEHIVIDTVHVSSLRNAAINNLAL